jgi:hypothetical protein
MSIIPLADKQQVCVFVPQKLPRCLPARGKLAFAPGGCKGLFGFPGDFGAMGQDAVCPTNVYLAKRQKRFFKAWPQDQLCYNCTSC